MKRQELLNHLSTEVYCRVMPSGSRGVGVFAIKDIPEGSDPFPGSWNGEYESLTETEINALPNGVQKMIKDYCIFVDGAWMVPDVGLNRLDVSFFLNHSLTPNIATENGERFYAVRSIQAGEELFVDYNTYSGESWR